MATGTGIGIGTGHMSDDQESVGLGGGEIMEGGSEAQIVTDGDAKPPATGLDHHRRGARHEVIPIRWGQTALVITHGRNDSADHRIIGDSVLAALGRAEHQQQAALFGLQQQAIFQIGQLAPVEVGEIAA